MRVLLVDDNKTVLKIHTILVQELNHEVVATASNGQEGLDKFKEFSPDVTISDIDMPIMDGIKMTKEIMEFDSFAKVLLVSAFESENSLSEALKSESIDYITKPINKDELKTILDRIETGL